MANPSGQVSTTQAPDPYAPANPVQYTPADYAGYGAVFTLATAAGMIVGKGVTRAIIHLLSPAAA
jgi:hypothetical protein